MRDHKNTSFRLFIKIRTFRNDSAKRRVLRGFSEPPLKSAFNGMTGFHAIIYYLNKETIFISKNFALPAKIFIKARLYYSIIVIIIAN
ncbi:MAG: hypothetical protein CG439_335 [Methylococcaceae bacterium NSP1-2]|nr:MAG: hypothetical protein CG439_335 [Methylococcaceae bacterium NSP1-2]